jgi:hypothetical protein
MTEALLKALGEEETKEVRGTVKFSQMVLKVHITQDSTKAEILKSVHEVCRQIEKQELGWRKTRLILGQMLVVVWERQLFKPEYETFSEYKTALGAQYNVSMSAMSSYLMVARYLPDLDTVQGAQIKTLNLHHLAQAVKTVKTIAPPKMAGLLKQAETLEVPEFHSYLEDQGLIKKVQSKTLNKHRLEIYVSKAVLVQWRKFIKGKKPAEVLQELMQGRRREDRQLKQDKQEDLPTAA